MIDDELHTILIALHLNRKVSSTESLLLDRLVVLDGDVVERVSSCLSHSLAEVRSGAALSIGYIPLFSVGRFDVSGTRPLLRQALSDSDPWVAFHAARSLRLMAEPQDSEVSTIQVAKFFDCDDPEIRVAALEELRWRREHVELVLPRIIRLMDDPVPDVRMSAAQNVARIGPAAIDALPVLRQWVDSGSADAGFFAVSAIIRIDEGYWNALIPMLLHAFESVSPCYKVAAICLLDEVVERSRRAVRLLADCYRRNPDREVQLAAVQTLASHAGKSREARSVFLEAVFDEDQELRQAATSGLEISDQLRRYS